jgi:PAS domain S-box-containing protein
MRRTDGQYRWHLLHGLPLRDGHGQILKWYGISTDIEDRRRAEAALHAAMDERTRLAAFREEIGAALSREDDLPGMLHRCADAMVRHVDAAFARIWTLNTDSHVLELQASAGMYTHLDGRHSRIPIGQLKIGLIAQERRPYLTNDVQNDPRMSDQGWARREKMIAFAGHPLVLEDRVVGVMGMFAQKMLSESTLEALSFAAGNIAQGIERKWAEDALRRSEAYLAEAQKLTHTGSFAFSPGNQQLVYWSEESFRIFGFDPQHGVPKREEFVERVHPGDRRRLSHILANLHQSKVDFTDEFRIVLPGGAIRHIHVSGHPVFSSSGKLIEIVGTQVDVTDRKRAEQERERLRQLEADLAHMNRVTTTGELTASLAHEINQPIAAAMTNASTCVRWLAGETPNIEEAREAAKRIVKDTNRAAEIISRIRLLFKKSPPQYELININDVLADTVMLVRSEAARHGVSVRADLAEDLPAVMGDRVQVHQVLINLMINGIDAMKDVDGLRELTVMSRRDGNSHLLVSVRDSGVGLPPDANAIFNAFFTTKPSGTGMGLAISRSIIESHGGRLWAEPNSGPGATFRFTLPTKTEAKS